MPITKILLEELPHGESRPGEKWRCVLNDDQALSATGEEISLALDEAISAHAKAVGVELEIKHRE